MTPEELQKIAQSAMQGLDLSNFKGEVTAFKYVENEIGNVEKDGVGIQHNYYQNAPQPEQQHAQSDQELSSEIPSEIVLEGKDAHVHHFVDAMLCVQKQYFKKDPPVEKAIAHTYDWCAALRLAKEIGIFDGFDDFAASMKNRPFILIPKNRQNLSSYGARIKSDTYFPHWQPLYRSYDEDVRKFKFIAGIIYNMYSKYCTENNLVPYSLKE